MKLFTRTIENFTCQNCDHKTTGNGYTNHCPQCLFSLHVDINPGDRQNPCHGPMKPIFVEKEKDEYIITHECQKCGFKKRNKTAPTDNFDEVIKISAKNSLNL
jgi:ribosomal protein L37AE/L43A